MNGVLKVIGFILFATVLVILNGYTLSTLWGWFIETKFQLPALGIAEASGVMVVWAFLSTKGQDFDGDHNRVAKYRAVRLVYPLLTLGFGWVILQWI